MSVTTGTTFHVSATATVRSVGSPPATVHPTGSNRHSIPAAVRASAAVSSNALR